MAGFFHLVTHAMFKACLFLGSGSIIYAMHRALHHIHSDAEPQDMRNMGGIRKLMPLTFITFLIATLSLCGVPLFSGFLSKDAILGGTLAFWMLHPGHWLLPFFGFGAAILTAFYMFRLLYLTFTGTFRPGPEAEKEVRESPWVMTVPLVILATLSVFFFYSLNPFSPEGGWFADLFPNPPRAYETVVDLTGVNAGHGEEIAIQEHVAGTQHGQPSEPAVEAVVLGDEESTPVEAFVLGREDEAAAEPHAVKQHDPHQEVYHRAHIIAIFISIFMAGIGILVATMGYLWGRIDPAVWQKKLGFLYRGMFRKWWVDEIYHETAVRGTIGLSSGMGWFDLHIIDGLVDGVAWLGRVFAVVEGWFDNNIIDGLVNLTAWFVGIWGRIVRLFQGGQIQRYVLYTLVVIGLFIILKVV